MEERTSRLSMVPGLPQPSRGVGSSAKRIGLIFLPPNGGTAAWKTEAPSGSGDGFILQAGSAPVEFTKARHGSIVHEAWFVWCNPNSVAAPVIEVFGT